MRSILLALAFAPAFAPSAMWAQSAGQRPPSPPRAPAAPTSPRPVLAPQAPLALLEERAAELALRAWDLEWDREWDREWARAEELMSLEAQRELLDGARGGLRAGRYEAEALRERLSGAVPWEPRSVAPRAPWAQDDPADSLYRAARSALNRGEYRRAASTFGEIPTRFTASRYAADALYWRAFALYRIGGAEDLGAARAALESQKSRYPEARTQADAEALATRILSALAARGNDEAIRLVRERAASAPDARCDREDQSVRAEALQAVVRNDPAQAVSTLRAVLARRDACSAALRLQAVVLAYKLEAPERVSLLTDAVRSDPEVEVRGAALGYIARIPGASSLAVVNEVLRTSDDPDMQQAAVRALARSEDPQARAALRTVIADGQRSASLRREAVTRFASGDAVTAEDVAFLRGVFGREPDGRTKGTIVAAVARMDPERSQTWLNELVRNQAEPIDLRSVALSGMLTRDMPVATMGRLYDGVSERPLRERIISSLGRREEPEATDKLIEIARAGTDPALRRSAIGALSRKKDPRTTRLLMEIINK